MKLPKMPLGKEHLVYSDFRPMPPHVWEWVKEQLEPFELHILSEAFYEKPGEDKLARGQIWVHPDGITALKGLFERDRKKLFPEYTKESL